MLPADLIQETLAKGYSLLLDESAIRNAKLTSYLIANQASLPVHRIVLLRSVANNPSGMALRKGFAGMPPERSPLILVGYDKPAGSALLDRGNAKKLAIITSDKAKAKVYADIPTGIPHRTIYVDANGAFERILGEKGALSSETPLPTPPASQDHAGPEYPRCIKPNHVFDYYGDKNATPPSLGNKVDVACPPSAEKEEGSVFVGAKGTKYELTVSKGAGGSARIYLCKDKNFVVKRFLNNQLYALEQEKLRFMSEHPILHPHIIWPLDMVSKKGSNRVLHNIGYVMATCPYPDLGGTFKKPDLMTQRFRTKENLLRCIVQLLDAFECMQQANIVNGDIKLENCAYNDATQTAYVLDIDAVQVGKYVNRMATPLYVPPEDWVTFARHGNTGWSGFYRKKSSDNYAIAVLLFYLLVGIHPYSSRDFNCANDEEAKAAATAGKFAYVGTNKEIQNRVHPTGYIRWTHLPSFIRDAFVDTFQKGRKHFEPKDRLSPGAWKLLFLSYLRMVRNPSSKLALADKEHYNEVAPLLAKNKKGLAELDLRALEISPAVEVEEKGRGLSLEAAVAMAIKNSGLRLSPRDVASGLLKGHGKYRAGESQFEINVCVPFLKVVTVRATIQN